MATENQQKFDENVNGSDLTVNDGFQTRADEMQHLVDVVQPLLRSFIQQADENIANGPPPHVLQYKSPPELVQHFGSDFPRSGLGVDGTLELANEVLGASVNTWSQGFMSHLYAATNPVGVISELLLAVLNTNVHVYETSPALSVIEKKTTRALASLFGLTSPFSGGVSQQGGSASNLTALVTARNSLFPDIKSNGVYETKRKLVLLTSAAGHYSLEKAAQVCGLGSHAVWSVAVDSKGMMKVEDLVTLIQKARFDNYEPFFVNATAGTTVFGSYDPLEDIALICKKEKLWFHIDASWGGGVVFSSKQKHKMKGSEAADSISFCPHKMLNVPITSSFLLVADLRKLWKANTLPAGYLFHGTNGTTNELDDQNGTEVHKDIWDIADMTLQCGRRGDALKMAMGWVYYGSNGYEVRINRAFTMASKLADLILDHPKLTLVSQYPPPCLSVCFYYGELDEETQTTQRTKTIAKNLRISGFAVEHAPGERGSLLRVVINLETRPLIIERLVELVIRHGERIESSS